jgi:cell surface protein SprA
MSALKIQTPAPAPRQPIGNGLLATAVGNPSMSRIRRLSVGIRNTSGSVLPQGAIWFDELRMGDVRRDMGWATRASANLVLSDFATLQAAVDFQNPDFLRLGQSRGAGMENTHDSEAADSCPWKRFAWPRR